MTVIRFDNENFDIWFMKVFDLNPEVGTNDPAVHACEKNGSDWLNTVGDIVKPWKIVHHVKLQNDAQSLLKVSLKEVYEYVYLEFIVSWENIHHNPSQNSDSEEFLGEIIED